MAWTTPRTWVTAELVTAATMNTHIRDNENALWTGLASGKGASITAAGTISVDHQVHDITGATTVSTILGGTNGAVLVLIAEGALNLNSVGNIFATAASGSRTVPQFAAVTLVLYANWFVAGVGS